VKKNIEDFKWNIIYNAPYFPQYHCIEYFFRLVKKQYKDGDIQINYSLTESGHRGLVKEVIRSIPKEKIKHIIKETNIMIEELNK
jgi:hypothetical protein